MRAHLEEDVESAAARPLLFGPRIRGRHRRPRPRKVLFAVGGLALAAGALSLVRLSPDTGVGGGGTAEAEPRLDPGGTGEAATNTAATVAAVPDTGPSATSPMGGAGATLTASPASVPRTTAGPSSQPPSATPTAPPGTTTLPDTPVPTAPAATPPPAPRPTPAPDHTTPPPTTPQPAPPGLCVPIIGLCVTGSVGHG
ncbi:hypothetical protein ACIRVK_00045 [Streptomyces sp. NPDC101152]|uniref:hypothetical protein n=1 Tax=Streptomyces sp. NPDC101152 TaxID=3366116 RepID=UPI00382B1F49